MEEWPPPMPHARRKTHSGSLWRLPTLGGNLEDRKQNERVLRHVTATPCPSSEEAAPPPPRYNPLYDLRQRLTMLMPAAQSLLCT